MCLINHDLGETSFHFQQRSWDTHASVTKMILRVDESIDNPEYGIVSRVINDFGESGVAFIAVFDGFGERFITTYDFSAGGTVLQCISDCQVSPFIIDHWIGDVGDP